MGTQGLCPDWPAALRGQREDWNGGIMDEKNENERSVSSVFYFPLFQHSM
jgi:hypothetical protein